MADPTKPTSRDYHWQTSYQRSQMTPHRLDWANQPPAFKQYPGLKTMELPTVSGADALIGDLREVIDRAATPAGPDQKEQPDLATLSCIFTLACGLTARARQPQGDLYLRSQPSAGALYPNEVYLAWPGTSQLAAGLYHFDPYRHQLATLRPEAVLPETESGPLFLVTGIFFKSAWKYRARAYRYVLLDGGHLLENLRLACTANGLAARLEIDFKDADREHLLGIDPDREGMVGCLRLSAPGKSTAPAGPAALQPLSVLPATLTRASQVTAQETVYPAMVNLHQAGRNAPSQSDFADSGEPGPGPPLDLTVRAKIPLHTLTGKNPLSSAAINNLATAMLHRRSRRNFVSQPLNCTQLAYLLELLRRVLAPPGGDTRPAKPVTCGCLVGQVDGLDPGWYLLDPDQGDLGRVQLASNPLTMMGTICLDQSWLAKAAVHFMFLSNPAWLDQHWGARGYRHAMITAGRLGQAIYLGATALGLGCCGIGAFYDQEASRFLGLNDEGALLYLLAAGPLKGPTG